MAPRSPLLTVMVRAADRAARHLKRDFGEVEQLQVSRKGPADFVSTADRQAERILVQELSKARPDFSFLTEESGMIGKNAEGKRFIIDPLDGTTNFLHGLPHFAISLAAEDRGELIAAVVYDPIKEELFTAEKGGGAHLNDRRLRVSARDKLEDSLLATGIPFKGHGDPQGFTRELGEAMGAVAGVRRWGTASLDLAYVAAGRYDGYWERDLSPWDIAAGVLLVREAGGHVVDLEGRPFQVDGPSILASNAFLAEKLMVLLGRRKTATKSL